MEYNEYYQKIRKYAQKALNGDLKTYLAGRSKYTYGTIDLSEYVKESVFEETTGKINDALDQEIEDRTNADTQINDSLDSLEKRVLTNENNIESLETSKLDNLTAGTGIDITNNIVSCTLDTEVFKIVESLPTTDINDNVIYVVPSETTGEYNKYIEYIYVNNEWEKVGEFTASLDLDNYYTKEETYSSSEIDKLIETATAGSITSITASGSSPLTLDVSVSGTSATITGSVDLDDYYTKEEVNDIIENDVVTDVLTAGVSPISLEYTRDGGLVNITASINLTEINEKIDAKLDKLTAGNNITITNNVISATASDTFNMGVGPKEVTSQSTHTNLILDTQFKGNTTEWRFGSNTEILEKRYCGNNVFYCSDNVYTALEFLLLSSDYQVIHSTHTFSFWSKGSVTIYTHYATNVVADGELIDERVLLNDEDWTFHTITFNDGGFYFNPLFSIASQFYFTMPKLEDGETATVFTENIRDYITESDIPIVSVGERNLLTNSQFDGLDGWTIGGTVSVASEELNGWKVVDIYFEYPVGRILQTINVSEGKYYKFSCWAKSDGIGRIRVTGSSLLTVYSENDYYMGEDWSLITFIMKANSTTSSSISIENYPVNSSVTSNVYISMPVFEEISEMAAMEDEFADVITLNTLRQIYPSEALFLLSNYWFTNGNFDSIEIVDCAPVSAIGSSAYTVRLRFVFHTSTNSLGIIRQNSSTAALISDYYSGSNYYFFYDVLVPYVDGSFTELNYKYTISY